MFRQDKSKYLPVLHRVKLIQDIFEWTKNGLGAGAIAKRLNQQNIPTFGNRSKNTWHTSYIQKILSNRSVLGEFQPHVLVDGKRIPEGEPLVDYFPQIISNEDFTLAGASQQSRRTGSAGRKGTALSNLFSGIVKCGYCQGSMVYLNKGHTGPRAKLLVCGNAKAGKECLYIPWEYPYFEQSVLAYCRGLDLENFLQLNENARSQLRELEEKIVLIKAALAEIENKESNILTAIESGAKFHQFEARAHQLAQEKIHIEFELRSAQKKYEHCANAKVDISEVRATIEELLVRMAQLSGDELYDLRASLSQQIKRLISRIVMYPGGYIEKPKFIAAYREHLMKLGHDTEVIAEHIDTKFKTTPNPSDRYFVLASQNASIRMIQPSLENPEILNIEMSETEPIDNIKLYAEPFNDMIKKFKDIAKATNKKL